MQETLPKREVNIYGALPLHRIYTLRWAITKGNKYLHTSPLSQKGKTSGRQI